MVDLLGSRGLSAVGHSMMATYCLSCGERVEPTIPVLEVGGRPMR